MITSNEIRMIMYFSNGISQMLDNSTENLDAGKADKTEYPTDDDEWGDKCPTAVRKIDAFIHSAFFYFLTNRN